MSSVDEIEKAHLIAEVQGTHWEGCETSHPRCAVTHLAERLRVAEARVKQLESAILAHHVAHIEQLSFMVGPHDSVLWGLLPPPK